MAEMWSKESCPACNAANWLPQLSEDDIGSYSCHACSAEIRLFAGEHQDEYRPHIEGDEPVDSECTTGVHWDGKANPS